MVRQIVIKYATVLVLGVAAPLFLQVAPLTAQELAGSPPVPVRGSVAATPADTSNEVTAEYCARNLVTATEASRTEADKHRQVNKVLIGTAASAACSGLLWLFGVDGGLSFAACTVTAVLVYSAGSTPASAEIPDRAFAKVRDPRCVRK